MTNQQKVRWIATTGILIALLVVLQWATAGTQSFAGQYITGSLVNCVLAVGALFGGVYCGIVVALLSPFCAFLLGIGPKLLQVVPAIALGNTVFVIALRLLWKAPLWRQITAVAVSALVKFGILYLAVVKVLIPVMGPALPAKQAAAFTVMFSYPQMITALIGGALALLLLPLIRKAIK